MSTTRYEAIFSLVGGTISGNSDGTRITYYDGQTPPTEAEIDAEVKRLQTEYDSNQYQRDRASEYPPIGDQLDMIYKDMKNGTTTHAEAVEEVKTKYPKG